MIVMIDMQIRDERFLEYLKANAQNDTIRINADDLARRFHCHPNTARRILKRLIRADCLEVLDRSYRGGFIYRVRAEREGA